MPTKDELIDIIVKLMTNPFINLGDRIYDVRENEGRGWDGPGVKSWSDTIAKAEEIVKEYPGKHLSDIPITKDSPYYEEDDA